MLTRNRIKSHRRVRAGDLVPHEFNFRAHPDQQKAALRALYDEVGFARSLLAYELPDGRLKLIDGHLRRDLDPDMEVDVEILAVNEDEARTCATACASWPQLSPPSCKPPGMPPLRPAWQGFRSPKGGNTTRSPNNT